MEFCLHAWKSFISLRNASRYTNILSYVNVSSLWNDRKVEIGLEFCHDKLDVSLKLSCCLQGIPGRHRYSFSLSKCYGISAPPPTHPSCIRNRRRFQYCFVKYVQPNSQNPKATNNYLVGGRDILHITLNQIQYYGNSHRLHIILKSLSLCISVNSRTLWEIINTPRAYYSECPGKG